MQFLGTLDEPEALSELTVQGFGVISHDVEAATLCGTFGPERTHNNMSAGPYRPTGELDVSLSLLLRSEEVEHSAVMPDVEGAGGQVRLSDIGAEPINLFCSFSQSCPRYVERGL